MSKNNFLFLHIPKTAGLSVISGFQNISENNSNINLYRSSPKGTVRNFSTKYFSNIDLEKDKNILTGHFVFSEHCKKFKTFSIVRETLDLFISNLYYQYKQAFLINKLNIENIYIIQKKFKLDLNFTQNDLSIIKKLLENNYLVSNTITKTLAGIPFEKFFFVSKDHKINNLDYQKALENLEHFSYIGNTEDTDKFLKNFIRHMNINSVNYKNVNIFKKDQNLVNLIKHNLKDKINNYNHYDIKILEVIKNKFN